MNKRFQYYIDLVGVLTQKELKVRYKNNYFGYLWSMGQPLASAAVFYVAFKVIMRVNIENYPLFIIAGLFPWQWFSNSVNTSSLVFTSNTSIMKKISVPSSLILLSAVLEDMIHFVLSIPVIVLFLYLSHKRPFLSWCYGIPVLLMIQLLIIYGISLAVASVTLFFKDLERLTGIFLGFIFYFIPIVYSKEMIPKKYTALFYANPLTPLMISWKDLFLDGTFVWSFVSYSFLYGLLFFVIGFWIHRRLSWNFAEVL